MRNFLKSIDQFGVPMTQSVDKQEPFFRTMIGGLITFVIYASSLAYGIYVVILWQSGEFSPKVSTTVQAQNYSGSSLNFSLMSLAFWKYNDDLIDPLIAKRNILTPFLYTFEAEWNSTQNILNNNEEELSDYFKAQMIKPKIGIDYQADPESGAIISATDMYIILAKCDSKHLKTGQNCATQEEMDAFFNQKLNSIEIVLQFTRLNSKTVEVEHFEESLYFQIEQRNCYMHNLNLKTVKYEVRDSFIPGQSSMYEYVDKQESQGQVNSAEYCKNAFDVDAYFVMYISIDKMQVQTLFEYPNVGDILANIGSIVSILFMAKYIIIAINSYFLQETIISQLYQYYYPEFKNITVLKNWIGRITSVKLDGNAMDIPAYNMFVRKLRSQMLSKISLTNMIYELSRLEFIVRSLVPIDNLRKCHGIGIKVKLKQFARLNAQTDIEFEPCSVARSDDTLTDEDCGMLSLDSRNYYTAQIRMKEVEANNDFYDINYLF